MIIGYFPGGGGNRYLEYTKGGNYTVPNIAYDSLTTSVSDRGVYCDGPVVPKSHNSNVLAHCVNYYRLKEYYPDSDNIVIIKTDLKSSLRREWAIKGKYKPMFYPAERSKEDLILQTYRDTQAEDWPEINSIDDYYLLPNYIKDEIAAEIEKNQIYTQADSDYSFINAAYTAICWHNEIYKKYPVDAGPAQLIDVATGTDQFSEFMRKELLRYSDHRLFNFAWDVYDTYGDNAPIITLYEELMND